MSTLRFLGACGTVTGSKFLLESGSHRVLLDCGVFQGSSELKQKNWSPPPFDPASLDAPAGVDVRAFVPDLYRHLVACDLAVVQGGLSTCMELTATKRPFIYVPLRNHFEQNLHVPHRLARYGAGIRMDYDRLDPEALAHAVAQGLSRPVCYRDVEAGGARRAAAAIAELL